MKNILKYLSIAGILILFLPFFKMCSEDGFNHPPEAATEEIRDSISGNKTDSAVLFNQKNTADAIQSKNTNTNIDNSDIQNGYQLGIFFIKLISDDKEEFFQITWIFSFFIFIIVNSFLIVLFSFKNKYKIVKTLAIINVLILISAYIILSFSLLENFNQIKYGSYLFIINSLLLIYFSIKKEKLYPIKL